MYSCSYRTNVVNEYEYLIYSINYIIYKKNYNASLSFCFCINNVHYF